eukprot:scaffold131968_cov42-Phaeocystis_antarctica.AAC.1
MYAPLSICGTPLSICGTPVQTLYLLRLYSLWPGVICGRIRKRAMAPEQIAAKALTLTLTLTLTP